MSGRGRGAQEDDDSDNSEEEDSGDEETEDYVGYLEKPPSKHEQRLLTRKMFPSKLGGRPAWLVPRNLPTMPSVLPSSPSNSADAATLANGDVSELECRVCKRPLRFLLQIYASRGSERAEAFHRVMHLFICTSCQPNQARVFRAQLPRENNFYSSDPPNPQAIAANLRKKGDRDPALDQVCCGGCGLPRDNSTIAQGTAKQQGTSKGTGSGSGRVLCQECTRRERNKDGPAIFQERELSTVEAEVPDEPEEEIAASGGVSAADNAEEVEEVFTPGVAKAKGLDRDLVAEAESVIEAAKRKGASEAVLEKLEQYKAKAAECPDSVLDGTEQQVFEEFSKESGEKDEVFSRFNRFAAANNGHVIRYNFGGNPLWFATPGRLDEPPPCGNCGGPRVFEFQVQPQLITLLSGTDLADRLDFGTICCFTCKGSCSAPDSQPYLEEIAFVQGEPREAWVPQA